MPHGHTGRPVRAQRGSCIEAACKRVCPLTLSCARCVFLAFGTTGTFEAIVHPDMPHPKLRVRGALLQKIANGGRVRLEWRFGIRDLHGGQCAR